MTATAQKNDRLVTKLGIHAGREDPFASLKSLACTTNSRHIGMAHLQCRAHSSSRSHSPSNAEEGILMSDNQPGSLVNVQPMHFKLSHQHGRPWRPLVIAPRRGVQRSLRTIAMACLTFCLLGRHEEPANQTTAAVPQHESLAMLCASNKRRLCPNHLSIHGLHAV